MITKSENIAPDVIPAMEKEKKIDTKTALELKKERSLRRQKSILKSQKSKELLTKVILAKGIETNSRTESQESTPKTETT